VWSFASRRFVEFDEPSVYPFGQPLVGSGRLRLREGTLPKFKVRAITLLLKVLQQFTAAADCTTLNAVGHRAQ
jgi:hypothetical protein